MAVDGRPPARGSAQGVEFTPRGPPLGCWRTPAGGKDPDVDDEEVTFQGGRGWGPSKLLP